MIGAMVYHGMPGFVGKARNPISLVPKAQVEVPVAAPTVEVPLAAPIVDVHHAAGVPGGVAAAAV